MGGLVQSPAIGGNNHNVVANNEQQSQDIPSLGNIVVSHDHDGDEIDKMYQTLIQTGNNKFGNESDSDEDIADLFNIDDDDSVNSPQNVRNQTNTVLQSN